MQAIITYCFDIVNNVR